MPSKKYNSGRRREKTSGDSEIVGIVLVIISAFIFLCITIRPILGIISRGIYGVTTGIFGLFSYPLFLCLFLWGIALIQGRSSNLSARIKAGIIGAIVCIMFILQLATTHAHLNDKFSAYISYVFTDKKTAGGVLFGVFAYAIQSVTTPVVSYILYSLAFVCFVMFCILLPIYNRRKGNKAEPGQLQSPFVKGMASPQQNAPMRDNSLFVELIQPPRQNAPQENYTTPLSEEKTAPAPSNEQKMDARKILFGSGKYPELTQLPVSPVDPRTEPPAEEPVLPPVLTTEPTVKSSYEAPPPPPAPAPAPEKPKMNVYGIDVPQIPPKDYSNEIVGGNDIINGDSYAAHRAEETSAPIESSRKDAELFKTSDFTTFKLEPTVIMPKEPAEPQQSTIVNGDYFGSQRTPERNIQNVTPPSPVSPRDPLPDFMDSGEETQAPIREEAPLPPIVKGSAYDSTPDPEERFWAQFNEDKQRAKSAAAQSGNVSYAPDMPTADQAQPYAEKDARESDANAYDEDSSLDDEASDFTSPSESVYDFSDSELPQENTDDMFTPDPPASSFRIIDDPIDLSEQSHFEGADNTGYYDSLTIRDIKPVASGNPVVRDQMKMDDLTPPPQPAPPKPKRKKHIKYNPPSVDMLITSESNIPENNHELCEEKARLLESTLQELKLPAKVTGITRGPAVTRFELEMPPGISVKKIESCAADIAYNLASNGKIRIEAPIPGKRAVGIEVPNDEIDVVRLREIIESREFQNSSSPLTLSLGKDIAGANIICNLEKMPHLLIAGATGSGKSACLNAIIISMLYKSSPEDVRMILIDPKRVEFNMYQDIPHLLGSQIINDAQQAINVLSWAKEEMDRRYTLFGSYRVRNLTEFNKSDAVKSGEEQKLTYIVIIVDELAELMMDTNSRKTLEGKIMSIAQKARAAGIHMILATQRPSVDVITGTIKANLPSRIAFTVKSIVDSRTILDESGAETLLGRGDMLYSPVGMDDPKRVQGAFVTDKEVLAVTNYVRENNEADFDEEFTAAIAKKDDEPETDGEDEDDNKEFDSLMPEVLKCVIESGSASTSMIQRRFSVGYARASRIIDQMEVHKFIGPLEGSKPRAVYISRELYKELFGTDI